MKKILVIILVFGAIIATAGIWGKNNQANTNQEPTGALSVNANLSNTETKILKVEYSDEDGRQFDDYEYYTYYYFNNNILTKAEDVYIFDTNEQAKVWYETNIQYKQNAKINNNIITKETSIQNMSTYEQILDNIKSDARTIGYTEEWKRLGVKDSNNYC